MSDDGRQDAGGWMRRTLAALGRRWRWRGGLPLADAALDERIDGKDAKLDRRFDEKFDRRIDRKFPPYRVETDGGADAAGSKDHAGQP